MFCVSQFISKCSLHSAVVFKTKDGAVVKLSDDRSKRLRKAVNLLLFAQNVLFSAGQAAADLNFVESPEYPQFISAESVTGGMQIEPADKDMAVFLLTWGPLEPKPPKTFKAMVAREPRTQCPACHCEE